MIKVSTPGRGPISGHPSNPFRVHTSQRSSVDPIAGFDEDEDRSPPRPTRRVSCALEVANEEEDDELDFFTGPTDGQAPKKGLFAGLGDANTKEGQDSGDDDGSDDGANEQTEQADGDDDEMADNAYYDSDPEERTLVQKSLEEQEQIEAEILDLIEDVPGIDEEYRILDRLGTGTFSSVYKAVDLHYHEMDNRPWQGHHPPESSAVYQSQPHARGSKVYVAIKRIYATSSPQRIENEIQILESLRGCRHISQIVTAFRHKDQIVVVMPYQRNVDFREFYLELPWDKIREYFKCLFRALRDVHARNIIHRDVKPANFLFDPNAAIGVLCDFGLAQHFDEPDPDSHHCYHTPPSPSSPHGQITSNLPLPIQRQVREAQLDVKRKLTWPSDRIGYPENDSRPQVKANRAGTRGFRPPEVLFKCTVQSGAIDTWAAGVILLFFLCSKFPIFRSNDDTEALVELATIFGRKTMERTATLHMRKFHTNVPSVPVDQKSWRSFCTEINPKLFTIGPPATQASSNDSSSSLEVDDSQVRREQAEQAEQAMDLLEHLLHADCTMRYTPKQALDHPWLKEEESDDKYFPHPPGQGVCGHLHQLDECGQHVVALESGAIVALVAGEGIPIGENPCELHKHVMQS